MPNRPSRPNRKQKRAAAQRSAAQAAPQIAYWMVAFLDLLGYRQVLADLDALPLPEDAAGIARMSAALGRAARLRRRLHGSFAQFVAGERSTEIEGLDGIPFALRDKSRSLRATRIVHSPGPDHYILAACLAPSPSNFPARAVYSAICATAGGMLIHLAIGRDNPSDTLPLRGGIDIAAGAVLSPENFLYSPALTRAYDLESKEAKYPRTLIGDRVREFLKMVSERPGEDIDSVHGRQVATRVQDMFFVDTDGKLALDFYGPVARETFGDEPARALGQKAWAYATAAERLARERGVARVTEKYEWLVAYMEPRRRHWL
jgi:hypothetical protein